MIDRGQETDEGGHRRILVIADKTCPCSELHDRIRGEASAAELEVLVVAPALNSRLRHWVSDTDEAVEAAETRLRLAVKSVRE